MKNFMGSDSNCHVEVAGMATIGAMLSFIGKTKSHAGLNTGWNMDGDSAFFVNPLTSLAGKAKQGSVTK